VKFKWRLPASLAEQVFAVADEIIIEKS